MVLWSALPSRPFPLQHARCNTRIEAGIRRTESHEQRLELLRASARCLEIDDETKCGVCHTNIGEHAMFVWYPNDVVVHFKVR